MSESVERLVERLTCSMKKKAIFVVSIVSALVGVGVYHLITHFNLQTFESFASTWGSLILTVALVMITAYYAWQTRQSVKIMEESSLPYVSVQLENESSHITDIYLAIRNDGDQAAFNVKLEILSGDIQVTETPSRTGKLSDMLFVKSELAVLSPKSERRHLILMSDPQTWKTIENASTIVKVTYNDRKGIAYNHQFKLEYAILPFSGQPRDSTYQKSEKSLQQIDKSLQEIAKK